MASFPTPFGLPEQQSHFLAPALSLFLLRCLTLQDCHKVEVRASKGVRECTLAILSKKNFFLGFTYSHCFTKQKLRTMRHNEFAEAHEPRRDSGVEGQSDGRVLSNYFSLPHADDFALRPTTRSCTFLLFSFLVDGTWF